MATRGPADAAGATATPGGGDATAPPSGTAVRLVRAGVGRRRIRWNAVAGTVVLVYLLVYAALLTQIADRNRFNRWVGALGSLGARLVLCVVVLAVLFHTLDGLRCLLRDVVPSLVDRDVQLRAAVLFLTWALALPCFAVLVWPWIAETTR